MDRDGGEVAAEALLAVVPFAPGCAGEVSVPAVLTLLEDCAVASWEGYGGENDELGVFFVGSAVVVEKERRNCRGIRGGLLQRSLIGA